MRNILYLFTTLISMYCAAQAINPRNEKHVLLIGNSLTYFHDMPQTLQKMVLETNPEIKIEQSTFAGMSLNAHLSDIITSTTDNEVNTRKKKNDELTETEKKIAQRKWDMIVLQTGTVGVLIPENREYKVSNAISEIKTMVNNLNCKFILFSTWPSLDRYPKQYCYPAALIEKTLPKSEYCSPVMMNISQEVNEINKSYEALAKGNDLIQSSHGTKFYEVVIRHPEINLYDDESHPSPYGSFLNACIFYRMLTGKKASELLYNGDIEAEKAKILKSIADE